MAFTYRNVVLRQLTYAEADGNFGEVERLYDEALEARDVAISDTIIYPTTTAGLAATAEGGYFVVPDTSTGELVYYREESGVAVQKVRIGARFNTPPTTTFAALPAASSVPGQIYRISDVGPNPGIEVVSNGTIWRPRGGRQVLAHRSVNPVTIQDTAGAVAVTLGPFPGGLIKSGMRLEMDVKFQHGGVGTGSRIAEMRIGSGAARNAMARSTSTTTGGPYGARFSAALDVLADTNAQHNAGYSSPNSFGIDMAQFIPSVNFSQAWSADIFLTSVNETAVNISSAVWGSGAAVFNTTAAHTLAVGDKVTIAGVTPSGYNGVFVVLGITDADTFSVTMAVNPGTYTSGGTSSRISNMVSRSYVLSWIG